MRGRSDETNEWDGGWVDDEWRFAEWAEVDESGRAVPSRREQYRAAVALTAMLLSLLVVALAVSTLGSDDADTAGRSSESTTSTTVATTTTTEPDPASVGGVEPSPRCTEDTDRDAVPLRPPPELTVLVLNGTSRTGHAGAITEVLENLGYGTSPPGNAGAGRVTEVAYTPGFCAEAEQLADAIDLPGAFVGPVDDPPAPLGAADLLVIAGDDSLP